MNVKIGNIVKIKEDAIKNGLLKERCNILLGKEGTIIKSGSAVCTDGSEVSVRFDNDTYDGWIIPLNSLELVREKKYVNLTENQIKEAKALYLHLLNHIEVQEAPEYRGMPICKICNKSAYQIYAEQNVR